MESGLDLSFSPVWCLPLKSLCSKNFQKESLSSVHLEGKSKLMTPACGNTQDCLLEGCDFLLPSRSLETACIKQNHAQLQKPHEIASYSFMKESTKSLGQ